LPRFAFALPCRPERQDAWHAAAEELMAAQASAHRQFLLDRGIFRERIWSQAGPGTPPLTLVLWDCADVDLATRLDSTSPTSHERWLFDAVVADFHGQSAHDYALPEPEVLSGTTTASTASAGSQTLFALPLPDGAEAAVRELMDRIEQGDLAAAHAEFLTAASIREEWIWLQEARDGTPALLLVHWIGDDLDHAWERLTDVGDDAYARVVREALFTLVIGLPPATVAAWDVEQIVAMHVRRTDSDEGTSTRRVAARLANTLEKRRWEVLARTCAGTVVVHEDGHDAVGGPAELVDVVRSAVADCAGEVDVMVGDSTVLCVLRSEVPAPTTALLFGLQGSQVTGLRVVTGWRGLG
jgi:hypothetical protein